MCSMLAYVWPATTEGQKVLPPSWGAAGQRQVFSPKAGVFLLHGAPQEGSADQRQVFVPARGAARKSAGQGKDGPAPALSEKNGPEKLPTSQAGGSWFGACTFCRAAARRSAHPAGIKPRTTIVRGAAQPQPPCARAPLRAARRLCCTAHLIRQVEEERHGGRVGVDDADGPARVEIRLRAKGFR